MVSLFRLSRECSYLGGPVALGSKCLTAETTIQVLEGTSIILNESYALPLLATFEKVNSHIEARNNEREMEVGLFRVSIPDIDKRAFREALVNAFCHRDYSLLGRIIIKLDDEGLTISNPGGFIEGISVNNLLDAEPHGRNPALADVLKRIGLAERTGRGIDRIFEGSLPYGRALPDYSGSNEQSVRLFIPKDVPDNASGDRTRIAPTTSRGLTGSDRKTLVAGELLRRPTHALFRKR